MDSTSSRPDGREPSLSAEEREWLRRTLDHKLGLQMPGAAAALSALLNPARRGLQCWGNTSSGVRSQTLRGIMEGALHFGTAPQSWSAGQWIEAKHAYGEGCRMSLFVVAVLGYGLPLHDAAAFAAVTARRSILAEVIFGRDTVQGEFERVLQALVRMGYLVGHTRVRIRQFVADLLLCHGSPTLNAVTDDSFAAHVLDAPSKTTRGAFSAMSLALIELGIIQNRYIAGSRAPRQRRANRLGVHGEWFTWCERWRNASPVSERTREATFLDLAMAGRWLAHHHPSITSPASWTMDLAVEYVRYVEQRRIGDLLTRPSEVPRSGEPMAPRGKESLIGAVRCFFRDLQNWEMIPRQFNPERGFAVPKQILRAKCFNPRPIDEAFWLKLRTASLSLTADDLPTPGTRWNSPRYPIEMVRALAVAWTFSGCRSDEIKRLEVGCTYVEHVPAQTDPSTGEVMPAFDQHMLRVPVNKSRGEFVKPVEEMLGKVLQAWETIRPSQPPLMDPTTGRLTHYLFCFRGQRVGRTVLNDAIIPILLAKGGLPEEDSRGKITSHRARMTLATKLYDSASGMRPLEVMGWLGHQTFSATQHYLEVSPVRLMTSFHRSAKLSEATRCVSVLVDRHPEPGQPIFRYDLGHGWCTNDAYAACAHRMACARCSFYEPAQDFSEALVKQSDRYIRMLQELRLTEDERAATTGDAKAIEQLLARLAAQPTPGRN